MRVFVVVLGVLALGACSLPTNVALQKIDGLRATQNACLSGNVPRLDDGGEPTTVGHNIAMACTAETDQLVQYAVPYATTGERAAFQRDAALRATGFVLRARGLAYR
jgi:hypothetical protein